MENKLIKDVRGFYTTDNDLYMWDECGLGIYVIKPIIEAIAAGGIGYYDAEEQPLMEEFTIKDFLFYINKHITRTNTERVVHTFDTPEEIADFLKYFLESEEK